jgi:predicted transcriptional regulator
MNNDKYILMSLNDPKTKHLSKVIGNKTCEKILNYLAENTESSEQDISKALNMPLNTVEYNLNKLVQSGLLEKTSNFFWSKKGKKIELYKVSNKSIIISQKNSSIFDSLKSILPISILSGLGAMIIRQINQPIFEQSLNQIATDEVLSRVPEMSDSIVAGAKSVAYNGAEPIIHSTQNNFLTILSASPVWWFIAGALLSLGIFLILKGIIKMKGGQNENR